MLLLTGALVATTLTAGGASTGPEDLRRFFKDVHSFTARFNQVVLDESLNMLQESSGTLWIQRPNRFRWNYDVPFEQQIVGDGKKIWVYDVELQQVTVRQLTGGLGNTPAILLAGRGTLDDDFTVKALGSQGKLQWLQLIPKVNDGGFEDVITSYSIHYTKLYEYVLHTGKYRRDADKVGAATVCDQARKRGLARAGRTPKDHRVQDVVLDGLS